MTRCMVGSVTVRNHREYKAILRVVATPKGRVYRCFNIPTGRIEDVPMNAVTLYCAWCKKPRSDHAKNQCLFAPTKFRPFVVQGMRTPSKTHGHTESAGNVLKQLEVGHG